MNGHAYIGSYNQQYCHHHPVSENSRLDLSVMVYSQCCV